MTLKNELIKVLERQGADFVKFVDISNLSKDQNKHYPVAILMGIILSKEYLKKVSDTQDYMMNLIQNNQLAVFVVADSAIQTAMENEQCDL